MSESSPAVSTEEEGNPMRWAKKPWVHLGLFTRQEAIKLLCEKMVSQKRRMLMKDCVRIIYYCQVQRSSGCRYEMSVCVPLNTEEKVRIDDFNHHTCDMDSNRLRRRALPQLEDFDRPIEKRIRSARAIRGGSGGGTGGDSNLTDDGYDAEDDIMDSADVNLQRFIANSVAVPGTSYKNEPNEVWTTVDIDVIDMTKRSDGPFNYVLNCSDQATRFSYAYPIVNNQAEVVGKALLDMMYVFGPPDALNIDAGYQNTLLPSILQRKFPSLNLIYYVQKRNHAGQLIARREAQQVRDRLFAWIVESGATSWVQELCAMKYAHNSEWIEELEGTPMDLFYRRNRRTVDEESSPMGTELISHVKVEEEEEELKVELLSRM